MCLIIDIFLCAYRSGVRGSRTIGEEPVVVPNIFSSFQGKAKRQFEVGPIIGVIIGQDDVTSSVVDSKTIKGQIL